MNAKFDIVYTDPPWKQTKANYKKSRPHSSGTPLDYPTLSLEEIKDIHKKLIPYLSDKHNIFMWTIDKYLFEAENMMKELGYILHARIIWDKNIGVPAAYTVRFTHEYLLWFYQKGHMLKPCEEMRGKYGTVLREQSTKHSKKPECAYKMIEDMFPDANKVELFARNLRNGWTSWGNEV